MLANGRSFPRLVFLEFVGTGQRCGYAVTEVDGVVLAGRLDMDKLLRYWLRGGPLDQINGT